MNILAFISGFSAHIAEDIEENTFYKREFKKYGNKLFNIFKKYEKYFHLPVATEHSDPSW